MSSIFFVKVSLDNFGFHRTKKVSLIWWFFFFEQSLNSYDSNATTGVHLLQRFESMLSLSWTIECPEFHLKLDVLPWCRYACISIALSRIGFHWLTIFLLCSLTAWPPLHETIEHVLIVTCVKKHALVSKISARCRMRMMNDILHMVVATTASMLMTFALHCVVGPVRASRSIIQHFVADFVSVASQTTRCYFDALFRMYISKTHSIICISLTFQMEQHADTLWPMKKETGGFFWQCLCV